MLTAIRSVFQSKIGAGLALAFLVVIAVAFASGDLSGIRGSGVDDATGAVAKVGDENISQTSLAQSAQVALQRVQQQTPTATLKMMIAQGGLTEVLNDLIDRAAVGIWGNKNGFAAGNRLVDSEIASIPAFKGVDGKFSQDAFRQAIAQRGISEQSLRQDIQQGLIARQIMIPASFGTVMPAGLAKSYAAMLGESREGSIIAVPAMAFAPQKDPTTAQLSAYYKAHISNFVRPERRVVRYAVLDEAAMKNVPTPTDAAIAARYEKDKDQYAAQDLRTATQLVLPSKDAAASVIAAVKGGKSLDQVAREKGLSTAQLGPLDQSGFADQTSPDVAAAIFGTAKGALAAPVKGVLGWYVVRVDEIQTKPAQSLEQVKGAIAKTLTEENARKAFSDTLSKIQDQFDNGTALPDVAKSLNLTVTSSQPITADGKIYGKPQDQLPAELQPVVKTVFTMEQDQPQVAEAVRGKSVILFDVTAITPSAPAPLADIKSDVTQAWKLDTGFEAAKAAALKVRDAIRNGKSAQEALSVAGKPLPPVQPIAMSRPQLSQMMQQGRQIPPPVALMFHMASGTVKVQAAPGDRGWFIVQLKTIKAGPTESADIVKSAQNELAQQLGNEYIAAMTKAMRKDVGVVTHPAAIMTVAKQLGGTDVVVPASSN